MFNKLILYSVLTSSISIALSATLFLHPPQKMNPIPAQTVTSSPHVENPNSTIEKNIQKETPPKIQVAILLDTSSSMSGLINQTRTELWSVINALSEAKKDDVRPIFEIALYEYGQNSLPIWNRQIRQVSAFTTDFDHISEALFSLRTSGGDEYSGIVIQKAAGDLLWSETSDDLKVIFIAGNESFDQGPVEFQTAISQAKDRNIIINTIHCGDHELGIQQHWQMGAVLGKGEYFAINQNEEAIYIETPFDDQITQNNLLLNETYLPYGAQGQEKQARQRAEDQNAIQSKRGYISRSLSKSSAYYTNTSWDLVDASEESSFSWQNIPNDSLPKILQNKSTAEKEQILNSYKERRESIKAMMASLKKKRQDYLLKQSQTTKQKTLGAAIITALKKQAALRNFIL